MSASQDHCFNLVRDGDKDRFLAHLFAPEAKRAALLALYAFNIEVSRVRDVVSEPRIGEIRFQWWHETVEAIYRRETADHPVAQELARAIEVGRLPKKPLLDMIAAHGFDLYDDPMPDVPALEGYLGETSSALIQMASLVLAGDAAASAEVAGLAGVAQGIANLLRGTRAQAFLPKDMDVSAAVAHARKRIAEARALRHNIPALALPAFLPVSLTHLYLDSAAKPVAVSQFRRQWHLWLAARREMF